MKFILPNHRSPSARRTGKSARQMVGSTLIEVLVALLLLSFTLLGIAGLIGAITRYQLGVDSRSVITLLFNDLTNRIRSNAAQANAYIYNSTSWSGQQSAISDPGAFCGATDDVACTPVQRAAYDVWELRTAIRRALPQGGLLIDGNPANGLIMSLVWFDKDFLWYDGGAPTLKTSPTCATSMSSVELQSCCPSLASVSSTAGVRCLNYTFIR